MLLQYMLQQTLYASQEVDNDIKLPYKYTTPSSVYCIWSAIDGANVGHEKYIDKLLLGIVSSASSKWMNVNTQSRDTSWLYFVDSSIMA